MKKLFKKSIAYLIAVLMVVSTMPFTAVTASAATLTETDIANATTNRVVIKDAIYTYASSSAYYNYGTTISTESDWNTPITSTSTITKVECLDDASVLSVTDGKLSGSFASNTFKVSGATNVFATLKFTFSDGKVEYHKVAVKSYPVENHIACESMKIDWKGSRTESGYTMFMRGSTGSGGADGVWAYQKSYATSGTGTHAIDGTSGIITSDKKAYAHGYKENGDAVPNVITKATYYVDKSCRNTNWSTLGNSELWNGTNYVVPIEVVRTKFFHDNGSKWNFDINNQPVANSLVRTDSTGNVNTNGTTYGLTFTHNASVNESNRAGTDETCNVRIAMRTTDSGWALLKTDLIVKLFDKSVARSLYTTCLNSATDGSEYTASSFLAYQNALLEMEAYLSNYEDATDATTSQAVYTNLNNAKKNLQSLYCTVTFSDAFFNTTTVKVREGATVPSEQFPALTKATQQPNKTQHIRYYFKNIADGSEFTTTTVVTSDVSVIETSITEDCSGGTATCTSLAVCDVCKSTYGSLADHSWGKWTSISDTQHKRVCANDPSHVETEKHNIVNGACTECDYVAFDMVAYNKAVAEYISIKKDPEYATKYTSTSITEYESLVDAEIVKESTFATQEEVDAAAAAILSAKTKLVYAKADVKVYIAREGVDPVLVETISKNYGETADINVADKLDAGEHIAKWVIETQEKKVNTKLATTDTTVSMVVTEPAEVYVHVAREVATESEQYSKVSFISKNGAVSFVKYVKAGETLDTTTDDLKVEIPFYKFIKWSKDLVTADGNDIEVKAVYDYIGEEANRCNVHYNGTVTSYAYDSFVYLFGAEGENLALATDAEGKDIITYLNENAFYAPHRENIYVIVVDSQPASIGITGSYMQTSGDTKIAAFNCKFYVPDDTCEVVEYGMIATSSKGSMKIKAEKASDRGEYCIKISSKEVKSISGKAYLTYRTSEGKLETIYSTTVTQNLR